MFTVSSTANISAQTSSAIAVADPGLGYTYDKLKGNALIICFVENALAKPLRFFHDISPVVKGLPFRSSLLDARVSLVDAVAEMKGLVEEGVVDAMHFAQIEVRVFQFSGLRLRGS